MADKIRFASINKNLFPTEKKEETERLSKDLQILKKEMTKGRMLISSLEEKRNKFSSEGSSKMNQDEMNKNKKGPFVPHDPSRIRMAARSSTFYLLHNRNS